MSQSLADVLLHVVFSTKNRLPLIQQPIEEELYRYMRSICRGHNSPIIEIGGVADHVHLLISFGRTVAISQLIVDVKTNSSRWIKTKGSAYQDFSWQGGYGVFSVARRNASAVSNYIAHQKEHHRTVSFKEEFLAMLKQAEVNFDEKFLWD